MVNIYVLSKDGKPLMPVHGHSRARRLIKSGKAYVYRRIPFTIRLTYDITDPVVDECVLGISSHLKDITGASGKVASQTADVLDSIGKLKDTMESFQV